MGFKHILIIMFMLIISFNISYASLDDICEDYYKSIGEICSFANSELNKCSNKGNNNYGNNQ